MHPLAVELEFVQTLGPVRLVDQFGELRFHPGGQRRRFGAPSSRRRSCPVVNHDRPFPEIDFELAEFTGSPAA
jgi:hypothetical protein